MKGSNEKDEDTLPEEFKILKCEGGGIEEQANKIKHAQEIVVQDLAATERDIAETESKMSDLKK